MEPGKNNNKTTVGLDFLATLVQKAVQRWTAESPRTYATITNVAAGVAIATTVVMMIPVTYPAWVIPVTAALAAIASKFTVNK